MTALGIGQHNLLATILADASILANDTIAGQLPPAETARGMLDETLTAITCTIYELLDQAQHKGHHQNMQVD